MSDTRQRFADAVEKHGANAVAKATGIPRNTVLSLVAGTAREGQRLLADQRVTRLDALSEGPRAA